MPYIEQNQRPSIDAVIEHLDNFITNAGTFNYAVTRLVHLYLKKKGLRYANCNEMVGALECIKQELYRSVIGPYEIEKIKENGPVGVLDIEKESGKY